MRRVACFFVLLSFLSLPSSLWAEIPQTIGHTGLLLDLSGVPLEEVVDLQFALYTTPTGGSPVWSERYAGVPPQNGVVEISLGSQTPFPVDFNQPYYIEVRVEGHPGLTYRKLLESVPTSLNSFRLAGKGAEEFAGADHNHTQTALSPTSLATEKITLIDPGNPARWTELTRTDNTRISSFGSGNLHLQGGSRFRIYSPTGADTQYLDLWHDGNIGYINSRNSVMRLGSGEGWIEPLTSTTNLGSLTTPWANVFTNNISSNGGVFSDDIYPLTSGSVDLGRSGNRWANIFGVAGNFSGDVGIGRAPDKRLVVRGDSDPLILLENTGSSLPWKHSFTALTPNMVSGQRNVVEFGKAQDDKDLGYIGFYYAGDSSTANYLSLGLHSVDDIFKLMGDGTSEFSGDVKMGSTALRNLSPHFGIYSGTSGDIYLETGPNGTGSVLGARLFLISGNDPKAYFLNGNVGIGDTTPDRKLTVNGDTQLGTLSVVPEGPHATIQPGTSGDLKIRAGNGSGGAPGAWLSMTSGNDGTPRAWFSNCRVGIGTSDPIATLHVNGDLCVTGGAKNAVVPTSQGMTKVYSEESTEVWFTDYGRARLIGGRAWVQYEPLFLETVTISEEYLPMIYLQEEGECNNLYVTPGLEGFEVLESHGGKSEVTFSYRVVAKRKGMEGKRLEIAFKKEMLR